MITIPASFVAYRDLSTKAMVDRTMNTKRAPATLTVDQCREFYRSRSMGEALKIEFWCFLYDLWKETWGKAVADLRPIPIGDKIYGDAHNDLDDAWDEARILAGHRLATGAALFTFVQFKDDAGVQLAFSVWKPTGPSFGNVTPDIKINGTWKIGPGADPSIPIYRTPARLVLANDKDAVNPEKLVKPAQDAVKAVLVYATPEKANGKPAAKRPGQRGR